MANILTAIDNLVLCNDVHVGEVRESNNCANSLGESLESYIKNLFAGTHGLKGTKYQERISEVFSYQGSASKPPDLMIRGGDAIEIKKLETKDSQIQLNSSFPKNKLHHEDPRVSTLAKNAEPWTEKDILYVVGNLDKKTKDLRSMWWIYGDCLVDDNRDAIPDYIFSNKISKSGRKDFIENGSFKIDGLGLGGRVSINLKSQCCINNFFTEPNTPSFTLVLRERKYHSFPEEDRRRIEQLEKDGKIKIVSVKYFTQDGEGSIFCKKITWNGGLSL